MKSAVYALLCFIFIVSGHIQEVEANLMMPCGSFMFGNCRNIGARECEKLNSPGKRKPSHCKCTDTQMGTYSCDCKLC
uniref:S-locus cysteine-rich protein n=1 Tax=Brassica oleracea TaxID=3712 RepID=Q9SE18_BRAOL|nr:S-locus cysteine-rich protein [Brassica oleracea]